VDHGLRTKRFRGEADSMVAAAIHAIRREA
jgi:hypothetical protein